MKAFLLAAGKGKRLLPFTNENPKPLVKVGGMSLIERNVLKLKQSNVDEVVINIHHLGEKIIDHLGDGSRHDTQLTYSIDAGQRYVIKKITTNVDSVFDKKLFFP